ncbi:hypothetical protein EVAR_23424_1 [Eumeta japonica]|uniref:Uncharacterized protein n=1 Tax=Eumeta variegata TaxID=151549 RepID=A0A4C1ULA4_EUMVA|nr:hypothetical protein EVAR_23424_1 [Eumeta japonica]
MQLHSFLQFLDLSIESKRLGSQNLSSVGSRTLETAMLILEVNSGSYGKGRRYPMPLNDYHQRSAVQTSEGPPMSMSRGLPWTDFYGTINCIRV